MSGYVRGVILADHLDRLTPVTTEAMKNLVAKRAGEVACPACGHEGMKVKWKLVAKPVGTFSLAGRQMKFSACEAPVLYCPNGECGVEATGKWE